jgi:hypothetical protein
VPAQRRLDGMSIVSKKLSRVVSLSALFLLRAKISKSGKQFLH